MAKIKLNGPFAEITGTMGDFYFRKGKKKGEVILAKRPGKSKKSSKAQRANWDRFSEASDYATLALADPELCAHYEAEARKQDLQPRNVAMADYLKGKNLLSK
jgi:hypothetical protein